MIISRRNFAAAAAAGGIVAASTARSAELGNPDNPPQGPAGIKGTPQSGSDPGPRNQSLDAQFPTDQMPPSTDHGHVDNFWFPFSAANKRQSWSRRTSTSPRIR